MGELILRAVLEEGFAMIRSTSSLGPRLARLNVRYALACRRLAKKTPSDDNDKLKHIGHLGAARRPSEEIEGFRPTIAQAVRRKSQGDRPF